MEIFVRNLKLSFRQIRREPGLSVSVILTLGAAIGATTAIFSFVDALLLRPFPFRDPEQLVEISSMRGGQPGRLSMREVLDIQEQVSVLQGIAGHTAGNGGFNYSGGGHPEEWATVYSTGNLFDVLGNPLAIASKWPDHADRQRDARVILSYGVWETVFGGRHDIVGQRITLDHAPGYLVDGVAPAGIDYPRGVRIYRSIGGLAMYDSRLPER